MSVDLSQHHPQSIPFSGAWLVRRRRRRRRRRRCRHARVEIRRGNTRLRHPLQGGAPVRSQPPRIMPTPSFWSISTTE